MILLKLSDTVFFSPTTGIRYTKGHTRGGKFVVWIDSCHGTSSHDDANLTIQSDEATVLWDELTKMLVLPVRV